MIFRLINYLLFVINGYIKKCKLKVLKDRVSLWEGSHIYLLPDFRIGYPENLILHDHVRIGHDAFIDAKGGVEIFSGVVTGPYLMIYSENHIYDKCSTIPFDDSIEGSSKN